MRRKGNPSAKLTRVPGGANPGSAGRITESDMCTRLQAQSRNSENQPAAFSPSQVAGQMSRHTETLLLTMSLG